MSTQLYSLLGLIVDSELPLAAAAAPANALSDVRILVGQSCLASTGPGAALLAERRGLHGYRAWRTSEGYTLEIGAVATLSLDVKLEQMVVHRGPAAHDELLSLLVSGLGMAFLIGLRGGLTLHASGVVQGDSAVLLVGRSGVGKSTLAGLLVMTGCALLADDAASVSPGPTGWTVQGGGIELRLRSNAAAMVQYLGGADVRQSFDRRTTVRMRAFSGAAPRLSHIVVPKIVESTRGESRRLRGSRALTALLRCLRLGGWCAPELLENHTRILAQLVRDVPVFELEVERSEVFGRRRAQQVACSLLSSCGSEHDATK